MFDTIFFVRKLGSEKSKPVCSVISYLTTTIDNFNREELVHKKVKIITNKKQLTPRSLIVAVGGDGTMLYAMRLAYTYSAFALGVNLGRVGFLTDYTPTTDEPMPTGIYLAQGMNQLRNEFREVLYLLTEIRAGTAPKSENRFVARLNNEFVACNEFSIGSELGDTIITYHLSVGGHDAGVHRANSVLVATPTGSTAYTLSAGGALMMPNMAALQIVPVAPLTMTSRPIIVDASARVEVRAWGNNVIVRADGTKVMGPIKTDKNNPAVFSIQLAGSVRIFHPRGWNYFDVLTNKLGWIKE